MPEQSEALPDGTIPDIDRCLNTGVHEKTFSAAACVASVGGQIFHRSLLGSLSQPPPIDRPRADALFDLASLTKPLATGLAALVLASRNRLDLGAPVSRTIPEFRNRKFDAMTIDMLLDHTAGFAATRNFWKDIADHDAKAPPTGRWMGTPEATQFARKQLADAPLDYEPGTKTLYSDLGFLLLGWIVEGVTSKPLDIFLAREVYQPLGLANDLFFVRHTDARQQIQLSKRSFAATEKCAWRDKLLQGEVHDPNAWALGGVAGHAGLFGTADAVWRLCHALWASFRGEDRVFLGGTVRRFWTRSNRVQHTTRTPAWDTPSVNDSMAGKRFSTNSVGHLGFTGCSIWIEKSTDVIGVVLTNSAHPSPAGKEEAMRKFRPRAYDLIAKAADAMPPDGKRKLGAAAFYDGPIISKLRRPG